MTSRYPWMPRWLRAISLSQWASDRYRSRSIVVSRFLGFGRGGGGGHGPGNGGLGDRPVGRHPKLPALESLRPDPFGEILADRFLETIHDPGFAHLLARLRHPVARASILC